MAEINIYYPLSDKGQSAALLAGCNAGTIQRIVLRSPDHVSPEAPGDIIARIFEFKLPEVPANQNLVEAVEWLAAATTLLARVIDPSTTANVVVEVATPELWALAVDLSKITERGQAEIQCGYDTESYQAITGFSINLNTRRNQFVATPKLAVRNFDRIHTAAELLPMEKKRRDCLETILQATNVELVAANKKHHEEAEF